MGRYSEYKDSGVQWLGEIPEHWEEQRMATLFTGDIEVNKDFEYKRAFKFNYGQLVPKNEIGEPEDYREVYVKYSKIKQGDILVNGLNLNYDFISQRVACAPSDGIITSAYVVCRPRKDVNYEYYTYLFKGMDSMKLFHGMGTGIRLTLSFKEMKKQILPIPPLSEQHSIVSYLDDKCGKIDKMLEGKQKQIELLAEMKQRIIADAVTRGLNPDVKMKATDIPWLPEIPEHWEMESLRRFLKIFAEKGHGDKQLLSVTREQGVIERNTDSKEENHNFIPEDLSGYKYVQVGDFVINKMKSWQGSYGVSEYEGIVSPAYFTCKLQGVDKDFFSTAIRSKIYVSFFARYSEGIRVDQWDLSPIALKSIPFALPPLDEQHAIVSYITDKTSKIDTLTSKLQQEIESIKEYKQRLISDVVTGQIKVC